MVARSEEQSRQEGCVSGGRKSGAVEVWRV